MSARRYKRLRTGGQEIAPLDVELSELLIYGEALLSGGDVEGVAAGGEVDVNAARQCWLRYGPQVIEAWLERWPVGQAPTTWGARLFDGEPQRKLSDPHAKRMAAAIDAAVARAR